MPLGSFWGLAMSCSASIGSGSSSIKVLAKLAPRLSPATLRQLANVLFKLAVK